MTRMVRPPREFAGLLFGLVLLLLPAVAAADDNTRAATSVKVALLSMKTSLGEFKLGGPVVVSRQDIESPLARVRSPKINELPDAVSAPDPRFQGVYLTPREYTGRSSLPPVMAAPIAEPPPAAATDAPSIHAIAPHDKGALPTDPGTVPAETKTATLSPPKPEADEAHRPAVKRPPVAGPPTRPKAQKAAPHPGAEAKTAAAPAVRKFTPADIGATRAFSRM